MNCLMIETRDKRKFFTHEKNFPMLIDFAKTFNAEISTVKMVEGQVLELGELAPAICDAGYKRPKTTYELVETKLSPKTTTRSAILKNADKIQEYIIKKFLAGDVVSLSDLRVKFKSYKLTTACFCNHMQKVIEKFKADGMKMQKVGAGKYKVAE